MYFPALCVKTQHEADGSWLPGASSIDEMFELICKPASRCLPRFLASQGNGKESDRMGVAKTPVMGNSTANISQGADKKSRVDLEVTAPEIGW